MANNLIQVKRTSVSGRAANSTTLPNPGELALNMTDGILYSTNGSTVFEVGANNTNARVSGTLTVNAVNANGSVGTNNYVLTSNGSKAYWKEQIIKDLADVAANGATDTQVLTYNSTLSKWVNQNPPVANVVYTTGYYGSFYDLSTQYATTGSNTGVVTKLANTFLSNGLTRTANNELQVAYAGVYQINYSLQFTNNSNNNETIWVWLRKNGTDVEESGTDFGIYPVKGSTNGYMVAVTALIDNANAGDKFQIMWATTDNTHVSMVYLANTAFAPEVPSAIVNITPISNIITAPPGGNTDITFNDSGLANGATGFTYNKTTNSVFVANNLSVGNTVNAAAFTVGGTFWANSTVVNAETFQVGSSLTANSTLVNAAAVLVRGTLTVNALSANGGVGTAGQLLFTDGAKVYWNGVPSSVGGVNTDYQYVWTNNHTFQNTITFGNSSVNTTVNSTFFTGTANNVSYVGSVSAANVVSNAQLSGNLANYQTTAGLAANVATLTSNNTTYVNGKTEGNLNVNNALTANDSSYLGAVAAASYVKNTDSRTLSGNLVFTGANTTVSAEFRVVNSTANVLYAAANGNLGVGINTPGAKLHVNGDVITGKLQHSPVPISKLLTGFDAADSDRFGRLSLSGDASVLAVGADAWEGTTGGDRGGVYIFDWNGSSWVQRGSVLEAADAADSDGFGINTSLSGDGTVLAVGALTWEGATGSNRGGVYIYDWNGSSWVQRGSVIEAADAADSDQFCRLSLSGDASVLAVGAPQWEGATGSNRGGVYIYDWNGSSWVQRGSVLEAADAADSDQFGTNVSLNSNGSILAVGAFGWEGATGSNRGGVYIYDWNGSSWVQRGSVIEAADAADFDNFFVTSISGDGTVLAVCAYNWEGATGTNRGGVYIFDWNGSNWIQRGSVLEAPDAADADRFGVSVDLNSDASILIVGADNWEGATGTSRGAIYTYSLTGALPSYSGVATGSGWIEGANSALIGRTAGLDRITVDISGNVGIGNTAPDATLAVTGTANVSGNSRFGGVATFAANVILGSSAVSANGGFGTAGQILHSNGTATYWDTDDQGVTSVASGDGLTGGPITATGTLSVLANTGIVANTSGLFVNAAYINTIGAAELGGFVAAAYVKNTDTRILSGNLNFTGANNYFTVQVGVNNAVINSSGVYAPSLYGNLTGNVAATNITGNLTGNVAATTITGNLTGNVVAGTVNATTINATSSIVVGSNVSLNTSVLSIGNSTVNVFVNSTAHVGNVVATSITGNLTGNVVATTISGNLTGNVLATTLSGNLTAVTANITNKIQVGTPGAFDFGSNAVIEIDANGNTYVQSVIQNANTGNNASADLVVTNDTGNDSFNYVDLGINGSNYNQAGYNISGQNDAYLYTSDGNLTIGTKAAKEVVFHANGTTTADRKLTINATAVTIANAAALVVNGSSGTAGQILTSNSTGVYWSSSANNADNLGGTSAASYQLNSTLNANIASYLTTYTGTANAARFQVGTSFSANSSQVVAVDVLVTGNLVVNGTMVTLNTATLDVKDLNITVAKGAASAAAANGAGLTVDTANATLLYINAGNTWLSNINFGVGNSTSNVSINSTAFIGNVVATRVTANLVGNVTATTISGNLTGNVAAVTITGNLTGNVAAVTITGNLTGNVAATTISGNLTGNVAAVTISGNLTGNVVAGTVNATTINATSSIIVGANVTLNASSLAIGNSTHIATPQIIVANTTGTTTINAGTISTTSITGNLTGNLTGNVVATTISGNLTGNVAATTISGNLTGNVAAVTITGNLTGNVVATTISGNLTGNVSSTTTSASANVTVGANVVINTSAIVVSNTTAVTRIDAVAVLVGNSTITAAPQILVQNSTGGATINPGFIVVGGNVVSNLTAHAVLGNSTTAPTSILTGSALNIGNTTITGAPRVIVANTLGTTTVNSNIIAVGGNVVSNLTAHAVLGNNTTAPTSILTGAALNIGNTTITGAPQVVVANSTGNVIVNASSIAISNSTVAGSFTANATVVNAVSYYAGTLLVANTTVINATHLGGISSNRAMMKRRFRIHTDDGTSLNSSITAPEMGFTYGGSGEPAGPYIAFGGLGGDIDYSCQLVGGYSSGGNDFKVRTRNDDTTTWNAWRTILTDGNYSSYSPTLTGTGASGTWGINVTGTAYGKTEGNLNVNNATTAYGKTEGNLNVNNATTAYGKAESALNVNSALTANNSTNLGGQAASYYTNATNITTGALPYAQIPANIVNTTAAFTRTGITTFSANVVLGSSGLSANGGFGTAGHVLHSNGTATYWAADDNSGGTVTSVASGNGITGGTITGTGTLSAVAGTGTVVNTSGIHVNATYIGTLSANNTTYVNGKTEGNLNVNNATTAYGKTEGNLNVNSALYANASISNTFTVGTGSYFVSNGNVGIGTTNPAYKLEVNGSFAATTKSFVIDHPSKPGMMLRYGSLEGPENGVYVRGKTNSDVIVLPDYWRDLVDEESITVNLAAIGESQPLYVKSVNSSSVVVNHVADYFFTVFAERKDVDKLVVEF